MACRMTRLAWLTVTFRRSCPKEAAPQTSVAELLQAAQSRKAHEYLLPHPTTASSLVA